MASVLIVAEGSPFGRTMLDKLKGAGHEAFLVGTGGGALAWMEQRPIDLALVDVNLKDIDGAQFATDAARLHPGTAVTVMSSSEDVQAAVEAWSTEGHPEPC